MSWHSETRNKPNMPRIFARSFSNKHRKFDFNDADDVLVSGARAMDGDLNTGNNPVSNASQFLIGRSTGSYLLDCKTSSDSVLLVKNSNGGWMMRLNTTDGEDPVFRVGGGSNANANFTLKATANAYFDFSDEKETKGQIQYVYSTDTMQFEVAGSEVFDLTTSGIDMGGRTITNCPSIGAGGATSFIVKTADETRLNTTTAAEDSDLVYSFDPPSSGTDHYEITVGLLRDNHLTPDIKAGIYNTSGSGSWAHHHSSIIRALNSTTSLTSSSGEYLAVLSADLRVAHTDSSGTVSLYWAQNTLDASNPTIVKAGAYMRITRANQ